MSNLKETLYEGWHHFFKALEKDDRQQLLEVLRAIYLEEAQDVAQFTQHVKYMSYPQFRASLRRIIAEEQAHVEWLRAQILALGGEIPSFSSVPKAAQNTWASLLMDLEEEKRSYESLLERMHIVEQSNPEVAEGLRRMREEERRHRDEFLDLLIKIDPYSMPPGAEGSEPSEEAGA